LISLVQNDPTIGLRAIRRATGFGHDRITRILKEKRWNNQSGLWRGLCLQPKTMPSSLYWAAALADPH